MDGLNSGRVTAHQEAAAHDARCRERRTPLNLGDVANFSHATDGPNEVTIDLRTYLVLSFLRMAMALSIASGFGASIAESPAATSRRRMIGGQSYS